MNIAWLFIIGLASGLLAGFLLQGAIGFPIMMLISAATVAVLGLVNIWRQGRRH